MTREILGKPVIEHVISAMSPVCSHIFVVTGHKPQELSYLPAKYPTVSLVYNKFYPQGMFSSILAGCRAASASSAERFFLTPGDCPAVSKNTYLKMTHPNWDILVPSLQGQTGHPTLLSKAAVLALLEGKFRTLQDFIEKYGYEIIEVRDPGILMDIDYPGDFKKMENYLREIK